MPRNSTSKGPASPDPASTSSALTVQAAIEEGTSVDLLRAMRARLARTFDSETTPPRDLAAISRRMLEIDDRIRLLEEAEKEEAREFEDQDVADSPWKGV